MKAAIVHSAGAVPRYGEFRDPEAAPGVQLVAVHAAAISQLTRARASGTHYSVRAAPPLVPGVDGVGTLADGRRVYFLLPEAPFVALAERVPVADAHLVALPDGLDDAVAAAMANPGMSAWAALVERAALRPGQAVMVHGANGASGRMAIQIARHLGAARVVATARRESSFAALRALGADETLLLAQDEPALAAAFAAQFERGVDVVLDYVWGPVTRTLLLAASRVLGEGVRVRLVQIGALGGAELSLPAQVLRSCALELVGSGIGAVPMPRLLASVVDLLQAAPAAGFRIDLDRRPLAQVEAAWGTADSGARVVLEP